VCPALPPRAGKAKISFVHERRGLERGMRCGSAEMDGRNAAKFPVDDVEFLGKTTHHDGIVNPGRHLSAEKIRIDAKRV